MDTITRRAKPTAASQAANTRRMTGRANDNMKWVLNVARVIIINIDNIIPSKHNREDIR